MPGSDWDRMVAAPSDVEMASALAEVRVRAIGHSVRQGKRRRMFIALALLVVAVVGAYAGRATAGLGATARRAGSASSPGLLPVRARYEYVPGPVQRFHITSWSELDGVRMNEAEGWVEGPRGTYFTFRGASGEQSYSGAVSVNVFGDTTALDVQVHTRTVLDRDRYGAELVQEVHTGRLVRLARGQGAVLYPFGLRRRGDEPVTMIRLDGPYAPSPALPVRWQLPDTSRWDQISEDAPWMKREAPGHGVRFAVSGTGALIIRAGYSYTPPPSRFRFTLEGGPPSVAVSPQSGPFVIPGVANPVRLRTHLDRWGKLCFQVSSVPGGAGSFLAEGCWYGATGGLLVAASQGQRLHVEPMGP